MLAFNNPDMNIYYWLEETFLYNKNVQKYENV